VTPRPLAGLLVLDLTRHLPGPYASRLLADLGARVVKVEEPTAGDPVRAAPPLRAGESLLAAALLAGVESVALDLKRPAAREVAARLAERADVLLESFRPGGLARLGLAPETLRERNPRLVLCSLSGWGQQGPLAARAGHDLTYQGLAGLLAPAGAEPAFPAADFLGAWAAVAAVLADLLERQRSGRGRAIDAALLDGALHANLTAWTEEAERPRAVGERLPLTGAHPCYALYRTGDGELFALALLEARHWRRFCEEAGCPEIAGQADDPAPSVRRRVAEVMAGRSRAAWEDFFAARDLPAGPVLSAEEALAHPQARARGVVGIEEGRVSLGFPALFDGERPRAGGSVPAVGAHTLALLEELGHPAARLGAAERRAAGIGPP
jgi:crotonobetainyl-CoA:carnitine CoA-transferase CaiB-like acyl-CoA transferase